MSEKIKSEGYDKVLGGFGHGSFPGAAAGQAYDPIGRVHQKVDQQSLNVSLVQELKNRRHKAQGQIDAAQFQIANLRQTVDECTTAINALEPTSPVAEASGNSEASASGLSNESSIQDQSPQPSSKGEEGLGLPAQDPNLTEGHASIQQRRMTIEEFMRLPGATPVRPGDMIMQNDSNVYEMLFGSGVVQRISGKDFFGTTFADSIIAYRIIEPARPLDNDGEPVAQEDGVTYYRQNGEPNVQAGFGEPAPEDEGTLAASGERDVMRIGAPPYSQKHEEPVT